MSFYICKKTNPKNITYPRGLKKCHRCAVEKPLTEYYNNTRNFPIKMCKSCNVDFFIEKSESSNPNPELPLDIEFKKCYNCKICNSTFINAQGYSSHIRSKSHNQRANPRLDKLACISMKGDFWGSNYKKDLKKLNDLLEEKKYSIIVVLQHNDGRIYYSGSKQYPEIYYEKTVLKPTFISVEKDIEMLRLIKNNYDLENQLEKLNNYCKKDPFKALYLHDDGSIYYSACTPYPFVSQPLEREPPTHFPEFKALNYTPMEDDFSIYYNHLNPFGKKSSKCIIM